MSRSVKVSAIVPVYNVPEKFLRRCVNSLINQSLKDIEIILVDDGTPDTSGLICDEFCQYDDRIKVIHQENKGLCGARNTGVMNASGEWISFVDGDDWIDIETYETLYESGLKNNVDMVMFGYVKDYPSKSIFMDYSKYFTDNKIYSGKREIKYLKSMILNYNANCAMAPTKFIRKEIIEKYNIYHDERLRQGAEGIEFNIRLFSKVNSVLFLNKNFYHYIYNSESITTVHNEENHKMVLECFRKIKSEIDNSDYEIMKWFYNRMKYVILTTAISGYFSDSNPEGYLIQKKKYNEYLQDELVAETLNNKDDFGLDKTRKMTLFFIRKKMFLFVKFISKIRTAQKSK